MRKIAPPHRDSMARVINANLNLEEARFVADEALNQAYGYGLSLERDSFGYKANALTALYSLVYLVENEDQDIERVAEAAHDGWSYAVYTFKDHGEKEEARHALANTAYADLDEAEKEKDRVVAQAMIEFINAT